MTVVKVRAAEFDQMAKLSHVPRKRVLHEHIQRFEMNTANASTVGLVELVDKVFRQNLNIAHALFEAGDRQRELVQTVVQVLSEAFSSIF